MAIQPRSASALKSHARPALPVIRAPRIGSKAVRTLIFKTVAYALLITASIAMLIPFVWLVSTSLKLTGREFSYPPQFIPRPVVWHNYPEVLFGAAKIAILLRNSIIVSSLSVTGALLSSSLVAFGFARIRFPGKDFWFMVVLSTMMLPSIVTIIPRFILFRNLKWLDTWLPLFVPSFFGGGAFNIFVLRQFFMTIPYDYDEAAKMDGASNLSIWLRIALPLARPALATVAVLTFMGEWGSFMDPLIYITTYKKQMVGVGLALFRGMTYSQWNLMMAGAAIQVIPVLVVFFAAQQYIIRGIVMTGLAGR